MKAIKGMSGDMKCRGFQYEIGKTYKMDEDAVKLCEKGFHAVPEDVSPLNVFDYYAPSDGKPNRFFDVDVSGNVQKDENKIVGSEIKVNAELRLFDIAKLHVEWVKRNLKDSEKESNTGYRSAATNTGYRSAATNTGDMSAATNTGDMSAATNTGYRSAATNTGDMSAAEVSGKESIAIVTGYRGKARGSLGCWLVLTERNDDGDILNVVSVKVDNDKIKENVWYSLIDGEIKEISE